jgi:hypothetical protein
MLHAVSHESTPLPSGKRICMAEKANKRQQLPLAIVNKPTTWINQHQLADMAQPTSHNHICVARTTSVQKTTELKTKQASGMTQPTSAPQALWSTLWYQAT